ncbi:hypothetical protein [Chishuiella changwenlii]|uniref:hypothetical protein n=1 Tax=Chishuiella changwenlii TaxID=1434701 RepID=UPI002FDAE8DB
MKKNILLWGLFFSPLSYGQVGINTDSPQKDLHVNGSLQLTNELNVGGTASIAGNSGTPGQVLVSQGANVPPEWKTLNTQIGDTNSFNLKAVYSGSLSPQQLSVNDSQVILGTLNNIKINSENNFILISMSSNTYLTAANDSPSISYRYDFALNGKIIESRPWESIQRQSFSDVAKNNPHQFTVTNYPIGDYTLQTIGVRQQSAGINGVVNLYFNKLNHANTDKPGSIVVYVYEK